MEKSINNITDTLEEMLTYFNRLYMEHDTKIKEYSAKLFEVNVRLDELMRTKSLYSQNNDYRKSVFSPITFNSPESEKETEIKNEIETLKAERASLEYNINEETIILKSLDKRIKKLISSQDSLSEIVKERDTQALIIKEKEKSLEEQKLKEEEARKLEIERQKKEISDNEFYNHLRRLIRFKYFDNIYHATILEKRVKDVLEGNNKKLDNVRGYIFSSPGRSKVLVDEISNSQSSVINILDSEINSLSSMMDDKKSFNDILNDYIDNIISKHPEIKVQVDIDIFVHKLDYTYSNTILNILDIIFDNIYKHSGAKNVKLTATEKGDIISFIIKDDGKGIPPDYKEKSKWYNGLNRVEELCFALRGNMKISNKKGTTVTLTFENK